jgi:hypothetical protein
MLCVPGGGGPEMRGMRVVAGVEEAGGARVLVTLPVLGAARGNVSHLGH